MTPLPSLTASLILAVLQGITEFLPVSSSGHLAAAQLLWPRLAHPGLTLEVSLHLGTTLAVLVYYRRLLIGLVHPASSANPEGLSGKHWLTYLVLGSVPTAAIGLAAESFIRGAFERLELIALGLAITGLILTASRWGTKRGRSLTAAQAIAIGTAQGFAILPGISRSGTTISLALVLGIKHRQAVAFSFLLSVPAILGAAALDAHQLLEGPMPPAILFVHIGFATLLAGAIGYACIGLVHRATSGDWWHRFAWYCWSLAVVLAWLAR
ncbi:MAG: undecaprenyl-diphosphate phosphatase [Acidobacteriota bacterium]